MSQDITASLSVWYLKNHSSSQLFSMSAEELSKRPPVHSLFSNKAALLDWSQQEGTDHVFYSLVEPENRGVRLTSANPARRLHGIVADFDTVIPQHQLQAALAKISTDYPVAYASATYSGGARLVWLFERPISLFGSDHTKRLLQSLMKEMKLKKLLPGLDEPAFLDAAKVYELGRDWLTVNASARVPATAVEYLSFQAAQKIDVSDKGPSIPLEEVEREIHGRFPGRWVGPLTVGAKGIRFWDLTARNPNGAWIRETGVLAFSGEGRFLPWAEILGADFVRKYEEGRISAAVQDTFYCSSNNRFWRKIQGVWRAENTETLRRHLVACGLAARTRGRAMSEVDAALHTIENTRRIDAAAPFLFRDETVVALDNRHYLNTARARPLQPTLARVAWSDGFPWIAGFLEALFPDAEQREVFLSWMARFYQGALHGRPNQGQVLVVAGPAESGKTLLSSRIIAGLVGGCQEATSFLTGRSEFNDGLFETPVWTVDDATGSANRSAHTMWTEKLKAVAANRRLTYRAMYQSPVTLEFMGRVVCTLNDDDDSVTMLPALDMSAGDKFIFLLASQTKGSVEHRGIDRIDGELPAFAAFLRDYATPADLVGSPRYGVVSYKHPLLKQKSEDNSPAREFVQILDLWRDEYFRLATDRSEWVGNSAELLGELLATESLKPYARTIGTAQQVGRNLAKARRMAVSWIEEATRSARRGQRYAISRPVPETDGATKPVNPGREGECQ